MPHLSRYQLSSEERSRLSDQFVAAVFLLRDRKDLGPFFGDLFSPTERAMIGKRLMIMILLKRGHSFADISSTLKVSQSTISSMSERLQRGSRVLGVILDALARREHVDTLIARMRRSGSHAAQRTSRKSDLRLRFSGG
ncbi:MAG: hypothetical protein A3A44_01895 [Candidatus Sungbacteria bacterium RIFCSPLOWO2_01_FULL_60_25]|uniref:Uncharacterized protein n=1 Tax=Candidatus Sungbacteria bacterium RIFCSPLOWO2_01_FULL_60_25 TaxID=1802281 RepID=A0A1G2LAW5_9BACT|nr:MAG: hypothetical protein A3A44_01895 [Candidatus Sungbacteria bacterium RIFCSPLOWO2_01_FULL_60_25]